MLFKCLSLILLAVFVHSEYGQAAGTFDDAGADATIKFLTKYGCSKGSTKIPAAMACFKAANSNFTQSVIKSANDESECKKYVTDTDAGSTMDLTAFCNSIVAGNANSRALVNCVSMTYGRYPDPSKVPSTPACMNIN